MVGADVRHNIIIHTTSAVSSARPPLRGKRSPGALWRYLWAFGIEWDRAVREDALDFMLWRKLADKPVRVHWRHRGKDLLRYLRPGVTMRRRDLRTQ